MYGRKRQLQRTPYLSTGQWAPFSDIPAKTFYQTQMDIVHRKQWDKLVVKLDLIERDDETGAETLQWVSQYPVNHYTRI